MEHAFYDLAEVLVCDPVSSNRAATRSALYSLGCRHIEIVSSLHDFLEALDNRPPDFAMCEAQVGEMELCSAIRDLRQGEKSYNPFAIIIVTAWKPNASLTKSLANAGVDGMLLRPFSAGLLDQRIRTHVLHRKPFVVTSNYVGPERRTDARFSGATSLVPPSSIRIKMEGRANSEDAIHRFGAELDEARLKLAAARLRLSRLSSIRPL